MTKGNTIRNSFILPNEIFNLGLSGGAILVYSYLRYCEDRKTYQCHPSYSTIGKAVGMSTNTVSKYVSQLVDKGLITTEPTVINRKSDGAARNGSLMYKLLPLEPVIEAHYKGQLEQADLNLARAKAEKALAKMGKELLP